MIVWSLLAWAFGLACLAGTVYQLGAAVLVVRFMKAARTTPIARPAVSVLRPLCGIEADLALNLRAACAQDYPDYRVVLGVSDPDDPAVPLARRVVEEAPGKAELVVDQRRHGANLKIGNLINMMERAGGEVLVLEDSDIAVDPSHLDDMVAPLANPRVGIVTSLYVGQPDGTLASRLGALGINHGFLPSALVARALGRKDGCFGAAIALRRRTLETVGGLRRFKDVLADDWALGAAVREQGLEIALASRPVGLMINEPDLKALLAHEIRWGRTIAAIDRPSYIASVITQPLALGVVAALFGGLSFLAFVVLAAAARLVAVRVEERALSLSRSGLGLLALRELLSVVVFVLASVGRSVSWRGRRFRVRSDGTMEQLEGLSI